MPGAADTIMTPPLPGVQARFSAPFAGRLADVSPPCCDDFLLPWDVYGLHKGQVLKKIIGTEKRKYNLLFRRMEPNKLNIFGISCLPREGDAPPHCHLGCFMSSTKVFKGWNKNPRYETNDLVLFPGTDVSHQGSPMRKLLVPRSTVWVHTFWYPRISFSEKHHCPFFSLI